MNGTQALTFKQGPGANPVQQAGLGRFERDEFLNRACLSMLLSVPGAISSDDTGWLLVFWRLKSRLESARCQMGKNSTIEWTHHTFNPWWGCTKVSQACKYCYAEVWAKRTGGDYWGPKAARRFFSEDHWNEPLKWDQEARATNTRFRVFCASMADVFEYRAELNSWREKLWDLIDATSNLDWLLLTKRPQRIRAYCRWGERWPRNVWLGTTVENQKTADERIPYLLENDAVVRFLSCEPLIGPVDLRLYLMHGVNWVIAGGESGGKSRPSHPDWIRGLREQCTELNIAFHFKQWGNWSPQIASTVEGKQKTFIFPDGLVMARFNKKEAGRMLDLRTWDQIPLNPYETT